MNRSSFPLLRNQGGPSLTRKESGMSHRDSHVRLNAVCLRQCFRWLLAGVRWSTITFRKDCSWTPKTLASAALLWAWSDELTLGERFFSVRKITMHVTSQQQQLAKTYQAFTKILKRWTDDNWR